MANGFNETAATKAIRHWREYPALGKVFKGADEYCDYLECDFYSLVEKYMKDHACSRAQGIRASAHAYPEKHSQWLAVFNIVKEKGD